MKAKLQEGETGGFILLPPAPDKCQACATAHDPSLPHNQQSLHYQYWFYGREGRWPTWDDAMAHCTPEMKVKTLRALDEILRKQPAGDGHNQRKTHT
jgi:hypothetical protein